MGIKLAQTAGFCMGVRRAVDIVLDIAENKGNEKVYTYGPLIHNPQTIELLRKRGVVPIDTIDDIKDGTIIIRAHGISLEERHKLKEKGIKIIDATCPKVARVQSIIKKHASLGYTVLIAGDRDHPEVVGLLGYSSGRGVVINNQDDIDMLPECDKVCVVAQTTQHSMEYEELIRRIKTRFPSILVFNTICDSTERRQEEIRNLASEMDAMIVVGGKNSANTKRLAQISRENKTPTFHIETADDLKEISINGYSNIGVSAGASTPNWIIDGVIDYLIQYRDDRGGKTIKQLYKFWMFSVKTDIYSSLGAGCLS
ncbi:MAG: 4-hydroxy-3-methylbut-2-enyl diphosphate reductase, partial [Deltaproteobacteria bacterium]|nr:4-hydroxy-3-methylbut-2-enyl diphosphate reductase [Deltaproteobacteria bacterium]